jgi:hypothetical protein
MANAAKSPLEIVEDLDAGRTVAIPQLEWKESPSEVRELQTLPERAFVRERST